MPATCFSCGEPGHIAANCDTKSYGAELGDGKPPWCGRQICDRETRLLYQLTQDGLKASRCDICHPQSHVLPVQYAKCRGCGKVIYRWDNRSECGKHRAVGKQLQVAKSEVTRNEITAGSNS